MRIRFGTITAVGFAALILASAALAFPSKPSNALGLTPAQKDKITALERKKGSEITAAQFGLGKPAEKRARVAQIAQKYNDAELAILTPPQRARAEAMQQARLKYLAKVMAVQKTLTPDQNAKAQRIRADYGARAMKILRNKKSTDAEKRVQYAALQAQMKAALESVLTSKQRAALPK